MRGPSTDLKCRVPHFSRPLREVGFHRVLPLGINIRYHTLVQSRHYCPLPLTLILTFDLILPLPTTVFHHSL
jgi:hypothetical protein